MENPTIAGTLQIEVTTSLRTTGTRKRQVNRNDVLKHETGPKQILINIEI